MASNPMPGPSQSGCVEKSPKKMGNGDRGSSVPKHTTVLDGLKAPETEFMENPRGLFCQLTAPLRRKTCHLSGAPFRDILEEQHMGICVDIQTLGSRSFSQFYTHAYENPEISNNNFPLEMIAGESLLFAEMATVQIERALQTSIRSPASLGYQGALSQAVC